MSYQLAILCVFITFAVIEAYKGSFFRKNNEVSDDGKVEIIGTLVLLVLLNPSFYLQQGHLQVRLLRNMQACWPNHPFSCMLHYS